MPRKPISHRRKVVDEKPKKKAGKAAKAKKEKQVRKPTHWLMLVKAAFAAGDVKGSTGLTEAMKAAKPHLPAFKAAFPDAVPSIETATTWIRPRL